jgi:hypothetical protein
MTKYKIQDRETGTLIIDELTLKDAQELLEEFEYSDKGDGLYEPDFYEIVEMTETI